MPQFFFYFSAQGEEGASISLIRFSVRSYSTIIRATLIFPHMRLCANISVATFRVII